MVDDVTSTSSQSGGAGDEPWIRPPAAVDQGGGAGEAEAEAEGAGGEAGGSSGAMIGGVVAAVVLCLVIAGVAYNATRQNDTAAVFSTTWVAGFAALLCC